MTGNEGSQVQAKVPANAVLHLLQSIVDVRPSEWRAMLWAFAYFFFVLASYFILRPLRDEMGIAAGRGNLQWLFTATFFVMLAASPVYAWLSSRLSRARLIPAVYHFFAANLLLFWLLLFFDVARSETAKVFFVWVSVFNLFVVSVFWSFMADMFRTEQGKRLFGFIAAGGTAGSLLGSLVTVSLATMIGVANLLLAATLLLELAIYCAWRFGKNATAFSENQQIPPAQLLPEQLKAAREAPASRGGMFDGFAMLLRSPYMAGIALWVALLSFAGTFLYFMQQDVVRAASESPEVRARIFAAMDLTANVLTLLLQFIVTGQVIKRLGTGPSAAILPLVFALGFTVLALSPVLAVVVVFQALQRTANFAFSNPAREILFTAAERDEKYKAKNLIDTMIFRGGDVVWGWAMTGLRATGLGMTGIALVAIPVSLFWLGLSFWLGRQQEQRAAAHLQASNMGVEK